MRNLKVLAAGTVVGLSSLAATPAMAGVDASAGISTEYIFRGVELGSPQVWGGLDWSSASGLYSGAWISSTSGGNEEVDLYAGYAFEAGSVGLDFGALYYMFPSEEVASQNLNTTEIYGGLTAGGFSGYLWFSPGGFEGVEDDEYLYVDLNFDIPLTETASIGAHVGATQPFGDAYDGPSNGLVDRDEVFFDFGLSLNLGDFFVAVTYLEDSDASSNFVGNTDPDTGAPLSGNISDNPSISAGYSWTFENVFH